MKKILVIGGTGFIGFNVCKKAIKKNFTVHSISKKKPKRKRRLKKVKYLIADLTKKNSLEKYDLSYDYVVNSSGRSFFPKNKQEKKKLLNNHYHGMLNLISALNKITLKRFVHIGSSMEYGLIPGPQHENNKCKPSNYYGWVKLKCTVFLKKKFLVEGFPSVVLRVFQVYGPNQQLDKIIPFTALNCKKDDFFKISRGNQLRDFLYIDDLIESIFKSLTNNKVNGKIINVGYGKPISIRNLVEYIRSIYQKGKPQFGVKKIKHSENLVLYPKLTVAKKILKWSAKISLKSGIKKTINSI